MRTRVKILQKEARICSQESNDNLQEKYVDDSRRFMWHIAYQIKEEAMINKKLVCSPVESEVFGHHSAQY